MVTIPSHGWDICTAPRTGVLAGPTLCWLFRTWHETKSEEIDVHDTIPRSNHSASQIARSSQAGCCWHSVTKSDFISSTVPECRWRLQRKVSCQCETCLPSQHSEKHNRMIENATSLFSSVVSAPLPLSLCPSLSLSSATCTGSIQGTELILLQVEALRLRSELQRFSGSQWEA